MTSFLMTWRYIFHVFCNFDVFWWPTGVPVLVTISTSTLIWRLAETTPESTFVETSNVQLHFGQKGTFLVPSGGHWLPKGCHLGLNSDQKASHFGHVLRILVPMLV